MPRKRPLEMQRAVKKFSAVGPKNLARPKPHPVQKQKTSHKGFRQRQREGYE